MAPTKASRNAADDKDTKEKGTNASVKMRRVASQQAARDNQAAAAATNPTTTQQEPASVSSPLLPTPFLGATPTSSIRRD